MHRLVTNNLRLVNLDESKLETFIKWTNIKKHSLLGIK